MPGFHSCRQLAILQLHWHIKKRMNYCKLLHRGNCNPHLKNGHWVFFNVLNFGGSIKRIFNTGDECNFVINELNPTSELQNMGNGAFQNALFWNAPIANGCFLNVDYSCLWALSRIVQNTAWVGIWNFRTLNYATLYMLSKFFFA